MTIATDIANVQTAVNSLAAVVASTGTLEGASAATLAPVQAAAQVALAATGVALADMDAATLTDAGSVAGVAAGGFAPQTVATFDAQLLLLQQQAVMRSVNSKIGRLSRNIQQANN